MQALKIKVLLMFMAYVLFMLLTMGMYWWNIDAFRERLTIMDEFHDVLSDILETRRYEKNFMFYPEPNSLKEANVYLNRAEKTLEVLHPKILDIVSSDDYSDIINSISKYRNLLQALANGDNSVSAETRSYGGKLVEDAQELLRTKKERIHSALNRIRYLPIAVMLTVLILITVIYVLQARKVLERLKYVQRAAEGVAKGDYDAIEHISSDDPISVLMRSAFMNMADELDTRQKQLIESRKLVSIGTLTSGIAHELNNPLNNVSLTADTLLEELEEMPREEMRELLEDIISEIARASDVVRNLLDFSRSEQRTLSPLKMSTVINQTLKLVGNQLSLHSINVENRLPANLPEVPGDLHYLEQVFINLFMNAAQAMNDGGTLKITGKEENETVRIDVADNGCGMDKETLNRIFDPFFTTKPVGQGTGLGLSIIHGIIKKHGGTIYAESEPGKGTTFTIHLPRINGSGES
ncbi:sensor histidine kinase [Maridesulfovibrio bastinii]|uniref:sensor histidine kinase n=1 Tax=Maridesulfovibrio bastinii TaxID=47157 RepID=UPI00041B31ED|nr:HAMP domain-containing sensor histidine kinase [Maridesulfovibrio bastinii]